MVGISPSQWKSSLAVFSEISPKAGIWTDIKYGFLRSEIKFTVSGNSTNRTPNLIGDQLCYLINSSFESDVFPSRLKIAKIIPLHRKESITDIHNYRPISILSVFSKIFEYAMLTRWNNFLANTSWFPSVNIFSKEKNI